MPVSLRDVVAWQSVIHRRTEFEGCVCEGGDGEGYPGYNCGCEPAREQRRLAGKRNRAQFRRYVHRILNAPLPSSSGKGDAE